MTEKSLKFEIDITRVEQTRNNIEHPPKRIEGKTVILRRETGKKPPPPRFDLDHKAMPKRQSRRQMAEKLKRPDERKPKVVLPPKIPVGARLFAFIFDLVSFAALAFVILYMYQTKLIAWHISLITGPLSAFALFSDLIYILQALVPAYFGVFLLPCLILEGTFGKRFAGLKIKSADSKRANFGQHLLRELTRPVSILSVIGILMGVFRPYRTLHDRFSRTKVTLTQQ